MLYLIYKEQEALLYYEYRHKHHNLDEMLLVLKYMLGK